MNKDQVNNILLAWYYQNNGDTMKDAFDSTNAVFDSVEHAFIALCEDHFGKDFINNWEPDN